MIDLKNDPSKPIECFRYPNILIVDDASIFNSYVGGLLAYPIDAKGYYVPPINFNQPNNYQPNNNIKILIYTSIGERPNWSSLNLSRNEIGIFIFKISDELQFRIKLADNLFLLSRFHPQKQEMLQCKISLDKKEFIGKKISIESVLSLFNTIEKPLFNVVSNSQLQKVNKPIKISKKGDLQPIPRNPVKDKLNITIGLFFDGTGNNKFNTELIHDFFSTSAENDKKGKVFSELVEDYVSGKTIILTHREFKDFMFKPKSSYLNNYSNIVQLYNLYNETNDKSIDPNNEIVKKIYIEGVGTKDGEEDSNFSAGLGRGEYGVQKRCEESIQEISTLLSKLQIKYPKLEIGEVVFDVFGFSRGAAVARLFYRRLFMDGALIDENLKNKVKVQAYKIRFYGLFETVISYSDSFNEDISLKLCKSPCYHIIAQNEKRENFPLLQVDADNSVHLELFGCHSDIGGSYTRDKFINSFAFEESEDESRLKKLKSILEESKLLYAVDTSNKNFNKLFIDQISLKLKQIRKTTEFENPNSIKVRENFKLVTKKGFVAVDKRIIESDISSVALKAMLLFASQHNLPFKEYKDNFSKKLTDFDKNSLQKYFKEIQELIKIITTQVSAEKTIENKDFFNIYNRFIHISENFDYTFTGLKYNDSLLNYDYTDQPTKDRIRVINLNGE